VDGVASLRSLFFGDAPVPKPPALPPPGFKALPVDKKIEYVQKLWDIIAADPDRVPVPAWHKKILDERRKSPSTRRAQPWSQVRREIESALRRPRRRVPR
jgi:hypothetical protein